MVDALPLRRYEVGGEVETRDEESRHATKCRDAEEDEERQRGTEGGETRATTTKTITRAKTSDGDDGDDDGDDESESEDETNLVYSPLATTRIYI